MSTITQVVSPYTKVPSINSPSTFNVDVDVFLNEINTRVTQTNTQSSQMNTVAGEVNTKAGIATTQAGIATTKAGEASASASSANNAKIAAETARDEAVAAVATLPDGTINDTTTTLVDTWSSQKISDELDLKQATLVSGTTIKTVNGTSLLGSGDISLSSSITLIASGTFSLVSSISFTSSLTEYDEIIVFLSGLTNGSTGTITELRVKLNSITTSNYGYSSFYFTQSSSSVTGSGSSIDSSYKIPFVTGGATLYGHCMLRLKNTGEYNMETFGYSGMGTKSLSSGALRNTTISSINRIDIYLYDGAILRSFSGNYEVVGVKYA